MLRIFCLTVVTFLAGIATVHALTVSPARIEVTGDPGQSLTGEIELYNEQQEERTFFSSFENFEPAGDSGAPRFIGASGDLATWMQTQGSITLAAGERRVVPYSITIPSGAQPGGYFAAIFWGTQQPSGQSGEISIGGKIGILVLLRVSGDVAEEAGLADFAAQDGQKFFSSLPVTFTFRVNNAGGDRIVPKGEVRVKNIVGEPVKLAFNEQQGSVLPGSTRKFEVIWQESTQHASSTSFFGTAKKQLADFHFGFYTASVDLAWEGDQTANASYSFCIVPWQLLLLVLLIIVVIGFLGRIFLQRYNRHIVARAMRGQK